MAHMPAVRFAHPGAKVVQSTQIVPRGTKQRWIWWMMWTVAYDGGAAMRRTHSSMARFTDSFIPKGEVVAGFEDDRRKFLFRTDDVGPTPFNPFLNRGFSGNFLEGVRQFILL